MNVRIGISFNSRVFTLFMLIAAEIFLVAPQIHTTDPCPALLVPQSLIFAAAVLILGTHRAADNTQGASDA